MQPVGSAAKARYYLWYLCYLCDWGVERLFYKVIELNSFKNSFTLAKEISCVCEGITLART